MNISEEQMRFVLPLEKTPQAAKYEDYDSLTRFVKEYLKDWDDVREEGVESELIEELWEETDLDAIQVQDAFHELKHRGEVYEPSAEVFRPT